MTASLGWRRYHYLWSTGRQRAAYGFLDERPPESELNRASGEMWLWTDPAREVQGFSAGDPRDGSIWVLFVDPANEGRVIGRALLALACSTVQSAGIAAAT